MKIASSLTFLVAASSARPVPAPNASPDWKHWAGAGAIGTAIVGGGLAWKGHHNKVLEKQAAEEAELEKELMALLESKDVGSSKSAAGTAIDPNLMDASAPIDTSAAPINTSAAPLDTSAAPIDTSAAPIDTSAAPIDETNDPSVTESGPPLAQDSAEATGPGTNFAPFINPFPEDKLSPVAAATLAQAEQANQAAARAAKGALPPK